jgi:hypothetical protein
MVVGSLLVMAAQTATAASTCSGMAGLVSTICGQNGYAGVLVDNPGAVNCAGDTCNNNDAITCCKPAALCTTITDVSDPFALSEVCSDNAVYAQAVTVGAFCAGTACALSDESRCCVVKANCNTITLGTSPSLTDVCGGDDAFTGVLIGSASSTKCAGATCGTVDKETCCVQKATCGTITANSSPNVTTVCGNDPGYTGALGSSSAKCLGATCDPMNDRATCCAAVSTCTSDYAESGMVASGAGTARGASITFTCDSGYAATENGVAECNGDGTWSGGKCEKVTPTCSVTDGSKATPWTGGTAGYEPCTCTGAAKKCTTLNVCDVKKKTCVCTPGKDHWCYEDAEHSFAVKFGCIADGSEFKGWKCVGDNVLEAKYSDAACTTHITPANGGDDKTFSATKVTKVEKEGGTVVTEVDTDVKGISTCKGGVAGAGAAAPGPAPGAAAPGPSGDAEFDAGSVAQCSTLAMLMVVAAMWAGRN